jgi:hypothetical protein
MVSFSFSRPIRLSSSSTLISVVLVFMVMAKPSQSQFGNIFEVRHLFFSPSFSLISCLEQATREQTHNAWSYKFVGSLMVIDWLIVMDDDI